MIDKLFHSRSRCNPLFLSRFFRCFLESVNFKVHRYTRIYTYKKTSDYFDSIIFLILFVIDVYRAKGSVSENKRTVHIPPKSTKMSIDKVPIVTTLLRAARSQDEDTLRQLLDNILKNGISEIELNADDSSGRVSAHNSIEYHNLRFLLLPI